MIVFMLFIMRRGQTWVERQFTLLPTQQQENIWMMELKSSNKEFRRKYGTDALNSVSGVLSSQEDSQSHTSESDIIPLFSFFSTKRNNSWSHTSKSTISAKCVKMRKMRAVQYECKLGQKQDEKSTGIRETMGGDRSSTQSGKHTSDPSV